jgi:hypothetical protein
MHQVSHSSFESCLCAADEIFACKFEGLQRRNHASLRLLHATVHVCMHVCVFDHAHREKVKLVNESSNENLL